MDFEGFEQIVLRAVFETREPLTPALLAYRAGVPIAVAERHLGRMLEQGTLSVRLGKNDHAEYFVPGARRRVLAGAAATVPPERLTRQMAVGLSVLLPGAGHIYSGRVATGMAWMATTCAGYALFLVPGLLMHGLCLLSAARLARIS